MCGLWEIWSIGNIGNFWFLAQSLHGGKLEMPRQKKPTTRAERAKRARSHDRRPKEMQKRFVEEFLAIDDKSLSTPQRAHQACVAAGYAEGTAYHQAQKLMRMAHVRRELMVADKKQAVHEATIDAAWTLSELASLWDTPLDTLFASDGTLLPIPEMGHQAQKLIKSFKINERVEYEMKEDENGQLVPRPVKIRTAEIRLIDRLAVLKTIGSTTKVNAFGTKEEAEKNNSLSQLMDALSQAKGRVSQNQEVEVPAKVISQEKTDE